MIGNNSHNKNLDSIDEADDEATEHENNDNIDENIDENNNTNNNNDTMDEPPPRRRNSFEVETIPELSENSHTSTSHLYDVDAPEASSDNNNLLTDDSGDDVSASESEVERAVSKHIYQHLSAGRLETHLRLSAGRHGNGVAARNGGTARNNNHNNNYNTMTSRWWQQRQPPAAPVAPRPLRPARLSLTQRALSGGSRVV